MNIRANPEDLLDWDAPLSQQSEKVRAALKADVDEIRARKIRDASGWGQPSRDEVSGYGQQASEQVGSMRGEELYKDFWADADAPVNRGRQAAIVSGRLSGRGIPGLRYLDGLSRRAGEGTRNYVIWDDSIIDILRKYGLLPPLAAAGVSGSSNGGGE